MASEGGQPAPSMCRVLYDFDSPADDEISLETGEVITVTQRDDGGGWRGELTQLVEVLAWYRSHLGRSIAHVALDFGRLPPPRSTPAYA